MIYIYIYEETINVYTGNNNRFSEYIQEDPIDSYLLKMNVEKIPVGKLELLFMSEIYQC